MTTTYTLDMDNDGRRFWASDLDGEKQALPAGFELRFFSEAPPPEKGVDGQPVPAGVNLAWPLGTRITVELPTSETHRRLEAEALARVLRRRLKDAAAAEGRHPSDAELDQALVDLVRNMAPEKGQL